MFVIFDLQGFLSRPFLSFSFLFFSSSSPFSLHAAIDVIVVVALVAGSSSSSGGSPTLVIYLFEFSFRSSAIFQITYKQTSRERSYTHGRARPKFTTLLIESLRLKYRIPPILSSLFYTSGGGERIYVNVF